MQLTLRVALKILVQNLVGLQWNVDKKILNKWVSVHT